MKCILKFWFWSNNGKIALKQGFNHESRFPSLAYVRKSGINLYVGLCLHVNVVMNIDKNEDLNSGKGI